MAAHLQRQLLHVGNQPGNVRSSLAGSRFSDQSAIPTRSGDLATRSEYCRHHGAALREGDYAIWSRGVVDRPARPKIRTARVSIPNRADRPGIGIGRWSRHPVRLIAGVAIAGRHHNGRVVCGKIRKLTRKGRGRGAVQIVAIAKRHVHGDDIVGRTIGDHPIQGLRDIRIGCAQRGIVRENLERDDIYARRHAGVGAVLGSDDAGDIRAMAIVVRGVRIVAAREVVEVDDAIGHAVMVGIRPEEAIVEIDTGIDHHHRNALSVDPAETGIRSELVQMDQGRIRLRQKLDAWIRARARTAVLNQAGRVCRVDRIRHGPISLVVALKATTRRSSTPAKAAPSFSGSSDFG